MFYLQGSCVGCWVTFPGKAWTNAYLSQMQHSSKHGEGLLIRAQGTQKQLSNHTIAIAWRGWGLTKVTSLESLLWLIGSCDIVSFLSLMRLFTALITREWILQGSELKFWLAFSESVGGKMVSIVVLQLALWVLWVWLLRGAYDPSPLWECLNSEEMTTFSILSWRPQVYFNCDKQSKDSLSDCPHPSHKILSPVLKLNKLCRPMLISILRQPEQATS